MKKFFIRKLLFFWLLATIPASTFAQMSEADAQRAISLRDFKKAREIYVVLADRNAEQASYKLWVARLSAWLGEYRRALQLYDDFLRDNPQNTEALLGKAYIFMWQKKYAKAKQMLDLAEKNDRSEAAFLISKINFFRYQKKYREAREAIETAQQIVPENVEVKELAQILEKASSISSRVGCERNFEPLTATVTACFANLNYERGRNRLTFGLQTGERFGKSFREIGFGWQRALTTRLSTNFSVGVETRDRLNVDANFGFNYQLQKRLNVGLTIRSWRLQGKTTNIVSASADFAVNERTQLQTTLFASADKVLSVRLNRRLVKPFGLGVNYIQTLTSDGCSTCRNSQKAFVVNGQYQFSKRLTLNAGYGFSQKKDRPPQNIYGFGLTWQK